MKKALIEILKKILLEVIEAQVRKEVDRKLGITEELAGEAKDA